MTFFLPKLKIEYASCSIMESSQTRPFFVIFKLDVFLSFLMFYIIFFQSNDEQWQRAMEYVSLVSELNYMTQVSQKSSGIQSIVKN